MTKQIMLYFSYILIFILGLVVGSFLNSLIWRLVNKKKLFSFKKSPVNRSYCPDCGHAIAWYDNIPVLSFALLWGRCRHCGKKISWQYPLVELATAVLFLMVFVFDIRLDIAADMLYLRLSRDLLIVAVMIMIFVIDLRWYLILDVVTLPAAVLFFVFNLMLGFNLWNLMISGIIGGSFFLIQFAVSRGKWIGGGDARLGLLMGLILGWPSVLVAIVIAYFIGSIIGIGLIISKKSQWGSQIPLGIFLSTATIITMFFGENILDWYL